MYLTISKRFEFCASRRMSLHDRNAGQNRTAYGPAADAEHGIGDNFVVYVVFHGSVDAETGMMISISTIKRRVGELLDKSYDHRNLNLDSPRFAKRPPTLELMAGGILEDAAAMFSGESAQPVACHLIAAPSDACTAYTDGNVDRHYRISFSAARRTYSPNISEEENKRLFGTASRQSGHGHNYRLWVTMSGTPHPAYGTILSYEPTERALSSLYRRLDHKHLNRDLKEFHGRPMTTELLTRFVYHKLANSLPVTRVRLYELDEFFVDYDGSGTTIAAIMDSFHSTHRLASPQLTAKENAALYGKCHNLNSHGHRYQVEASAAGTIDEETGTIFNLVECQEELHQTLSAYHLRHLDLETEDFIGQASTGENIVGALWPRVNSAFGGQLTRLRLWETPNNRFTLRELAPTAKDTDDREQSGD